jgi:hypothetical protein
VDSIDDHSAPRDAAAVILGEYPRLLLRPDLLTDEMQNGRRVIASSSATIRVHSAGQIEISSDDHIARR